MFNLDDIGKTQHLSTPSFLLGRYYTLSPPWSPKGMKREEPHPRWGIQVYFISLNKSKGKDSPSPGSLPSFMACSNKEVGLYDVTDILGCWLLLSHFSHVGLCATPSLGFSRQEHWSGLPFPSPMHESEKWKWSRSVMSDSSRPHGLQPTRLLRPWDFPGKSTGVGCHCLLCGLLEGTKNVNLSVDISFQSEKWLNHSRGWEIS